MTWPQFPQKENSVPKLILIVFLIGVLYLFYLVIRPFLNDIFISILITLVFYPVYKKLLKDFPRPQNPGRPGYHANGHAGFPDPGGPAFRGDHPAIL